MSQDRAFIGFDENVSNRELKKVFKQLETLSNDVETKDIRSVQRKALKPMVQRYKENIKSESDFTVYRNGGVFAEIKKGQLKKSIGIISTPVRKENTFASLQVGARVRKSFSDVEKGGWYAHFVEYGFVNKYGKFIKGANFAFAEKAKKGGIGITKTTFMTSLKRYLDRKVKRSIQ
tara:strand:+ start:711 stop:1238 length:528 start_codon:yes stop_codon:yes gene_type:complete